MQYQSTHHYIARNLYTCYIVTNIATEADNGNIPSLYEGQWIDQPLNLQTYAGRGFVESRKEPLLH